MENLVFSFNAVGPIFLVVALGYYAKVKGVIDQQFVDMATKFNFKYGFAALIFMNLYTAELTESFNPKLIAFIVIGILACIGVLMFVIPLFTKDKRKISAMVQCMYRTNVLLLGLPLAINMLGEGGVGPLVLMFPITVPIFNSMAVIILLIYQENSEDTLGKIKTMVKGIVTNPLIIASVVGVVVQLNNIQVPIVLEKGIEQMSNLATPLALITVGAQFSFRAAWGNVKYSLVATIGRLVIIPIIMVGLGHWFGFNGNELGAIFIIFAAPTATASYVMAKEMGSDEQLTGEIVLLTTFFSMFTMFVGIYMMKTFGLI